MSLGVHVTGLGLWAPGFADVDRWRRGDPDPSVTRPRAGLLTGAAGRRATPLTHLVAHVLDQACAEAGVAPAEVAVVLASVGGELDATFACLRLLLDDPPASSPLRFASSLHSSPLGHVSVAAGARGFGSAITAPADRVVAMGLLEATTWVEAHGGHALLVLADDAWPHAPCAPLAVGLLLSAVPAGRSRGRLGPVQRGASSLTPGGRGDAALRANPSAGALDLLDAVLDGREGAVPLSSGARPWVAPWWPAPGVGSVGR